MTSDLGSPSGQGLDFIGKMRVLGSYDTNTHNTSIDGFVFLQRFYSVYDSGNARVGLATTPFTDAETN